jgi:hypothetical protein
MIIHETLNYLFDNNPHILRVPLTTWMKDTPRFADFVTLHQAKIRKKIKSIRNFENAQDLRAELETAYLLLQEKRFDLAYEPYNKKAGRGPDFAVTFKTHTIFNVEVTRMRYSNREHDKSEPPLFDPEYEGRRLADNVSSKLSQMLPGMMNLLVIVADDQRIGELEVGKVMNQLKQRAEQKDSELFRRHNFRGTADFFNYYQRLSGVLLRNPGNDESGKSPILWLNNQTKHPLPAPICTILG